MKVNSIIVLQANPIIELQKNIAPTLMYIAYACFAIGAVLFIMHFAKVASKKSFKDKYDIINSNEIKNLKNVTIAILAGVALIVSTLETFTASQMEWLFVKAVVIILLSIIVGVIFFACLNFYYPFVVDKKLKKLRYTPRVSPKTGKEMKLLSEDEEDVYLDEGMQAEENVFSVDYDVWIDEETGFTIIEKYQGHLTANKCPDCNYQTLKVVREEVITSPDLDTEGELDKFLKCIYCGYKERRTFKIAKLKENTESSKA